MEAQVYRKLMEKTLSVKWKTKVCSSGEECWCRMIVLETPFEEDVNDEVYIVGGGSINKIHAEYLVKLHNENLK